MKSLFLEVVVATGLVVIVASYQLKYCLRRQDVIGGLQQSIPNGLCSSSSQLLTCHYATKGLKTIFRIAVAAVGRCFFFHCIFRGTVAIILLILAASSSFGGSSRRLMAASLLFFFFFSVLFFFCHHLQKNLTHLLQATRLLCLVCFEHLSWPNLCQAMG